MSDTSHFYFQNYDEWRLALTERCRIDLTPEYARSRIAALEDPKDSATQEFTAKYGEAYLRQVIEWFEQAAQGRFRRTMLSAVPGPVAPMALVRWASWVDRPVLTLAGPAAPSLATRTTWVILDSVGALALMCGHELTSRSQWNPATEALAGHR